jgi:NAD+--asparagine ADP-ribosyltransferase
VQRTICFLVAALALTARAADEPKPEPAKGDNFFERAAKVIGRDAKSVAHAAKQAGKDIGHAAGKAGRDIGHAATDVGKDIGHAASKAGKKIADAFKPSDQKAGTEGKDASRK